MWYFKGRRKKYNSPYTGKEVDEAVAKANSIPDGTVADAGKFLRVNNEGKIDAIEYPIETQVDIVYSGNVTTTESPETVSVVAFSGTAEDFSQLNVVVNNETLAYNSDYSSFDDANETVSILFADGYIKLFAYNANTFAVEIKQTSEVIDEEFAEGVKEVSGIPSITVSDAGKFLGVTPDGNIGLIDGGGGGVYCHKIKTGTSTADASFVIYSSDSNPFTGISLAQALKKGGYDSNLNGVQISAISVGNVAAEEGETTIITILTRVWCAYTQALTADYYRLTFTLTSGIHQLTSITHNNGFRPSVLSDIVSEIVPPSSGGK